MTLRTEGGARILKTGGGTTDAGTALKAFDKFELKQRVPTMKEMEYQLESVQVLMWVEKILGMIYSTCHQEATSPHQPRYQTFWMLCWSQSTADFQVINLV